MERHGPDNARCDLTVWYNLFSILALCLGDVKSGKRHGDGEEHRGIGELFAWADSGNRKRVECAKCDVSDSIDGQLEGKGEGTPQRTGDRNRS